MSRSCFVWGMTAALAFWSTASAQAPAGRTEARAEAHGAVHRSSTVIGATVNLKDGHRLGKVEDFVFDDNGCISMAVVTYGDYYIAVPWNMSEFDFNDRTWSLNIERGRLKEIPTFTDFKVFGTPEFRSRVDKFFGVRDGGRTPTGQSAAPNRESAPPQSGTGTSPTRPGTGSPPKATRPRGTAPGGAEPPRGGQSPNPNPAPKPKG